MADFYVPQSLLDSMGITSAQAQAGQFTKGAGANTTYTPAAKTSGNAATLTPGSAAWNAAQPWNDIINAAVTGASGGASQYTPGSWQSNVATATGALPGGGYQGMFDKQFGGFMDQLKASQQAMLDQQKAFANSWNTSQQTPTLNNGQSTNQWGLGSPTYSPTSKNGYGMGWGGSNPFKIGSF